MKLTKNFVIDAFGFEIIPMAGNYRDTEIFVAVTVLVLSLKVIIARNNDHDSNEYASISILQTYPTST